MQVSYPALLWWEEAVPVFFTWSKICSCGCFDHQLCRKRYVWMFDFLRHGCDDTLRHGTWEWDHGRGSDREFGLAKGNKNLEAKTVGLIMSMVGYGMLLSPAVGGFLSEPLQQHPNNAWFQEYSGVLERFPFILPNLVAAILQSSPYSLSCCVWKRHSQLSKEDHGYGWERTVECASTNGAA